MVMDLSARTLLMARAWVAACSPVPRMARCFDVFAGERIGGDGAGSGSADGRDLTGVNDADGRTGLRLEEDDEALVRLAALRGVLRKDADEFCAEWFGCAERAGHDAEEVSVGERDDGAEELPGFAGGEG